MSRTASTGTAENIQRRPRICFRVTAIKPERRDRAVQARYHTTMQGRELLQPFSRSHRISGFLEPAAAVNEKQAEGKSSGDSPPANSEPRGLESLYDKMNKAVRENLEKAGELTEETLERALKESREWARQLREHYADDVPKVVEFLRRDFQDAIRLTREQARKNLDIDRLGVGVIAFVQRMAQKAGSRLDSFASSLGERLNYKTGEIAGQGTLTCLNCGQKMSLDTASRIPPCPKCRGTGFRRSY